MNKENSGSQIAVIGMAVNFPGAPDKDTYWVNLSSGVDSTGKFPHSRELDLAPYVKMLHRKGITYKKGGYLNDISSFDYNYFKIPKAEAKLIQPAQRLFLENAITAMEDAGYGGNRWYGKNIGVFAGCIGTMEITGYQNMNKEMGEGVSPTGLISSGIAGRLSYFMNFTGESVVVDSACSSSFAALKYACNSLKLQECDGAVVGGVQLNIFPDEAEYTIGIESSDGHTRAFDLEADGTGISEGICTVILKRLSDAVRDKDHIYAVIQSAECNQDGRSLGLSAPNPKAQTDLLIKTCRKLELNPIDISYMELHGTGTKLGDSIEMQALNHSLEKMGMTLKEKVLVGSVKANIGHTFAASGLAGLIKCCLMLEHKKICPQINFKSSSYQEDARFQVNKDLMDVSETGKPLICCISNYGLSGTNYMCVLSSYSGEAHFKDINKKKELFLLSAMTELALSRQVHNMISFLIKHKNANLSNICYTSAIGRGHYQHRLAIICESAEELKNALENFRFCSDPGQKVYYSRIKKQTDPRQKMKFGELNSAYMVKLNKRAEELAYAMSQKTYSGKSVKEDIAFCYISGADIDWETVYSSCDVAAVSMPGYSFDRLKCWTA